MTPAARSKRALEAAGYLVETVEKWNPFARIRQDLWGFADLLAIRRNEVLAVQVTTRSNVNARICKIAAAESVERVREAGVRIEVHGWAKNKAGRWACRVEDLS